MKILIDWGGYSLNNRGDTAMLQIAVERLSNIWSDASIQVITTDPEKLAICCPKAEPLSPYGRETWFFPLCGRARNLIPTPWRAKLEWQLRSYLPSFSRYIIEFKFRKKPERAKEFKRFMQSISDADLVVAAGGGYITDSFEHHAVSVLETLRLAVELGKPSVMFGQGLGPINNKMILDKAKAVLPSVALIGLREQKAGVPILNSINVAQNKMAVTGDDAIELAYKARSEKFGNGIGINLRYARYSGIDREVFEIVRLALHDVARRKSAPLVPIPISFTGNKDGDELSDSMSIQKLLRDYDDDSDGGQSLETPLKVIQQVGSCRVVVTGSYHAGVFALSQGIPVVALAKSEYYMDKFLGLADQFEVGCEVVSLNTQKLREKLVNSISTAYESSEQLRPQLLAVARKQIELGQMAYKRVYEVVNSR